MSWKPLNFQGLASLDNRLGDDLEHYLQEKETQLSNCILHAIHPLPRESLPPVLPYSSLGVIKLSDAVDALGKNVRQVIQSPRSIVAYDDWKLTKHQINLALWEYVEVLEGAVTELFQQLEQMTFEQWQPQLEQIVTHVKNILADRIDKVIQIIPRIEELLWKYRWALEERDGKWVFFRKIVRIWQSMLDRSLLPYIKSSAQSLKNSYQWFITRYNQFLDLKREIEQPLKKFEHFEVLKMLDESQQESFKKIYQLLRIWEVNVKTKVLPKKDIVRAIRAFSSDKVYSLFKEYYQLLRRSLFDESRLFKIDPKENFIEDQGKQKSFNFINNCILELQNLQNTIEKYREFYLLTHPNPYVRSRLGWSEWLVGPEPEITKSMQSLVFDCYGLQELFEKLRQSLEAGPSDQEYDNVIRINQEIQNTIHEIGRPLTSQSIQRNKAEKWIHLVEEINELGSFEPVSVESVERALSKGLRVDWQYHVFFDFPAFKKIYEIHQGITGPVEDRAHMNRLNKFKQLLKQINSWVLKRESHKHVHEIELDMNDIKIYLQDFLAYIQRLTPEQFHDKQALREKVWELSRELVDYRFLFGNFFHSLLNHGSEGKIIRNQFLFVDQYFETIETRIFDFESILSEE